MINISTIESGSLLINDIRNEISSLHIDNIEQFFIVRFANDAPVSLVKLRLNAINLIESPVNAVNGIISVSINVPLLIGNLLECKLLNGGAINKMSTGLYCNNKLHSIRTPTKIEPNKSYSKSIVLKSKHLS